MGGGGQTLEIYAFKVESLHARVGLYKDLKERLRATGSHALLACLFQENSPHFRLSLITRSLNTKGGIDYSHPRRQSFLLGKDIKTNSAERQLSKLQGASSLEDIEEAFSLEQLNQEFFQAITKHFTHLYENIKFPKDLNEESSRAFSLRLLARVLFCKFLERKGLIPSEIWNTSLSEHYYYHEVLEPLFFGTLNTPKSERNYGLLDSEITHLLDSIPYLNGGLFSPQANDFYEPKSPQAHINTLKVPTTILTDLFKDLSEFHFTIDESTPIDQEVGLDPEMLGMVFENLLSMLFTDHKIENLSSLRKQTGSYYTPREIVSYMAKSCILEYLKTHTTIPEESLHSLVFEYEHEFSYQEILSILTALSGFRVLDPACGSGAFPMGILQELTQILEALDEEGTAFMALQSQEFKASHQDKDPRYIRKLHILQNCIYGVDIQPMATEISRLRCFLSLICDEDSDKIEPLPNLEFKFLTANSLLPLTQEKQLNYADFTTDMKQIQAIRQDFLLASTQEKDKLKESYLKLRDKIAKETFATSIAEDNPLLNYNPFDSQSKAEFFDPVFMFGVESFDCVIGNPPYISNKGTKGKDELKKAFGFSDDLYVHFFFVAQRLVKQGGIIAYITPNTFWTIDSKRNLRELLFENQILEILDSKNPFSEAMVNTSITIFSTQIPQKEMRFVNTLKSFDEQEIYSIVQKVFQGAGVFFIPTPYNLAIKDKFAHALKPLYEKWWSFIDTSDKIAKNKAILQEYRQSLKSGDITLMGLLTDGGVGLQTGNNGKFVGVREGSKEAKGAKEARAEKLYKAESKLNLGLQSKKDALEFLAGKTEQEIWELFDDAKEKFGKDIFGQGFLFRIISDDIIADVKSLSQDEKANGINSSKCFVPYDKGDKDGNRWYLPTPYYIAWSRENVKQLQTDPKARWQGYKFFFREGFCWIDVNSTYLKCRLKGKSVNDVLSMSMYAEALSEKYFVCIINSRFMSKYVDTFINNTSHFQINDARQIPIIIPTQKQLESFEKLFDRAYASQVEKFQDGVDNEAYLLEIQKELDAMVYELYGLGSEEIELIEKG